MPPATAATAASSRPLGDRYQARRVEIVISPDIPSWQDPGRGTMARCALWLVAEVGVGEVFTKTELRDAFPETSQIDRRMRDLRDRGWKIATNRDDPSLTSSEHRFVAMGAEVWKPGQSKAKTPYSPASRRRSVVRFSRLTSICAASAASPPHEVYEGGVETAQLDVARREVIRPGAKVATEMITECRLLQDRRPRRPS